MNPESPIHRILEPLYLAKGWIKFVGVLAIIQGVLTILSLWGILICWLPIWMGVLLCGASNQLALAFATDNEAASRTAMEKLGTYFRIMGILAVIGLVLMVVGFVAALMIPAFMKAREIAG
jgi:hypothetical protein